MGTKRVGLARMETLMENLSREILMGGSTITARRKVIAATTTKVLTAADSGALVTIDSQGGAYDITLPAVSNTGVYFDFVVLEDTPTADVNIKAAVDTTSLVGFTVAFDSNAADSVDSTYAGSTMDALRIDQLATAGTHIWMCSDGTQWLFMSTGAANGGTAAKTVELVNNS